MVILTGATFADSDAVLSNGIGSGDRNEFDLESDLTDDQGILLGYEDDEGDFRIAVAQMSGGNSESDKIDDVHDLVILSGVQADDVSELDFNMIA
jgi:hypothetical protein